jgi:hypothetical protein
MKGSAAGCEQCPGHCAVDDVGESSGVPVRRGQIITGVDQIR